ncbi:hypothetical protein L1Y58_17820, partial [Acinetobacter baumannii]|nr:hypothetical protein [Acinetobacter baumannii]
FWCRLIHLKIILWNKPLEIGLCNKAVLISNKVTWLNQRNLQRIAAFILTFFAMPIGYSAISSF